MTRSAPRRAVVHALLALVIGLQLMMAHACPPRAPSENQTAIADISRALGVAVVLCRHGDGGSQDTPAHHNCCDDCGVCPASVVAGPPPAEAGSYGPTAIASHASYADLPLRLVHARRVAGASARGPPLAV